MNPWPQRWTHTADNARLGEPHLYAFMQDLWRTGHDTEGIARELRVMGFCVTQAGVANALARARDDAHAARAAA